LLTIIQQQTTKFMFTNCFNEGVQMTFENGLTISIQWGTGNYCENRSFTGLDLYKRREMWQSSDAEIGIWNDKNEWYNFGSDSVKGWVKPDEVADWIYRVKNAESIETI
jgi:hypothetical protein